MRRCNECGVRHNPDAACPTVSTLATQAAAGDASTDPAAGGPSPAIASGSPAAAAPAGLAGPAGSGTGGDGAAMPTTLEEFYATVRARNTGALTPEIRNVLQDITQTSVGVDIEQPDYVGQLWDGVRYQRRVVPLIVGRGLTSYKVRGWKWTTKPVMAPWAGDKTDVPSAAVGTETVETSAERLAGAHDIDRKFRDFNDTEFFEAYYAAMTDSYARLSDAAATAAILAAATDEATPAYEGFLGAIAAGVAAIDDDTNAASTFVLANKLDVIPWVLSTTEQNKNVAALLALIGVDIDRITLHTGVPEGHVVVGTSAAIEFRELPNVPIRVEAIDLVKGGVDAGVFGYYATLLHDAGGLQDVTIDPVGP